MSKKQIHPVRRFGRCTASVLSLVVCTAASAYAQTAPAPASSPVATPSASPTPAPVPNSTWQTNVSGYSFKTTNPNATGAVDTPTGQDLNSRTDYSNIQATVTRNTGPFRFGATIGEYAFPVVGQALNPTFKTGTNSDLFSYVPVAYVQYLPNAAWTFTAGKLAALLGQESNFTYQNVNIERGLGWNTEPAFTRGVRAAYARGKFTGTLGYSDGYYSGRLDSLEGLLAWAASANTTMQFAFELPQSSVGPNPTAVIANKREANLMLTQQFGKMQLLPYLLWIDSPQNTKLGYNGDERAFAGVFIANYVFDGAWSLGARYESIANRSSTLDGGANADLVGFGPGSKATTFTITPAFKTGHTTLRAEYSTVNLGAFVPGLGFGTAGVASSQSRIGFELAAQF
jgi:hypothetical protein